MGLLRYHYYQPKASHHRFSRASKIVNSSKYTWEETRKTWNESIMIFSPWSIIIESSSVGHFVIQRKCETLLTLNCIVEPFLLTSCRSIFGLVFQIRRAPIWTWRGELKRSQKKKLFLREMALCLGYCIQNPLVCTYDAKEVTKLTTEQKNLLRKFCRLLELQICFSRRMGLPIKNRTNKNVALFLDCSSKVWEIADEINRPERVWENFTVFKNL